MLSFLFTFAVLPSAHPADSIWNSCPALSPSGISLPPLGAVHQPTCHPRPYGGQRELARQAVCFCCFSALLYRVPPPQPSLTQCRSPLGLSSSHRAPPAPEPCPCSPTGFVDPQHVGVCLSCPLECSSRSPADGSISVRRGLP